MAKGDKREPVDRVLDELTKIRNLLILALYGNGYPSEEISKAVQIDASGIRGMFSKKNIKKSSSKEGRS